MVAFGYRLLSVMRSRLLEARYGLHGGRGLREGRGLSEGRGLHEGRGLSEGRGLPVGRWTCSAALTVDLTTSSSLWRGAGRVAAWLRLPIALSHCAAAAATLGFSFHHARGDQVVLALWLAPGPSRLPAYATHQIGVAGAVVDESNGKVLVVQDKNKTKNAWKFPGGLSELGEDIGCTAVREVREETGVLSEFVSLLSVRQQHRHPGAFGMSDLYLICRLRPLTHRIHFCTEECLRCDWLPLAELARADAPEEATPIARRVARLLLHGLEHGFQTVELPAEQLPAAHPGLFYQLYHRALPPPPLTPS
ncbi:hypothetical protein CRUP_016364 [Coryphaenoides rupestris]|nr:hypothetical protein CRUP_016364 [Coryphaenoides rupestris]